MAENHLPPIDLKKKAEMENIRQDNLTLEVKKQITRSNSSIRHQESNASSVYDDGGLSPGNNIKKLTAEISRMKEAENSRVYKKSRSKVTQDKDFLTEDDIAAEKDYKIVGWNQLTTMQEMSPDLR